MPRTRRFLLAVTATLSLLAGGAGAAAALDLDSILARSSYSQSERQSIQAIFSQADRQRVPRDILLPRLAEGVAKGVTFQRTAEVLNKELRYLSEAKSIMESTPAGKSLLADPAAWSLSATLLETGADEKEIMMLEDTAQGRSAAYRLAGLLHASLMSWGLSRQVSLQVSLAALRSSLDPEQYLGLVDILQEGRQRRVAPDRMAARIIDALPGAKDMDDLKRAVLY